MNVVRHQALLSRRTHAFWQGNKRVLYGLVTYGLVSALCALCFFGFAPADND